MEGFSFWAVNYTSYESNKKWYMVRTPDTWDADMVMDRAKENNSRGGVGDDPAYIDSVECGWDDDTYIDYCDNEE